MTFLRLLRYTLVAALRSIRTDWKLHTLTVATIATTFVIFGGALLLFQNVRALFLGSKGETEMTIFLREGREQAGREEIQNRFCKEPFVVRCDYVSAAEARRQFVRSNPDLAPSVSALNENPFPASVQIDVDPKFRDTQKLGFFSNRIATLPSVEGIAQEGGWLLHWIRLLNLVDVFFLAVAVALAVATIFVVSNTVRILAYSKRDEVEILTLVGATDRIIRAPFLVEGMIQGGVGALAALGILRALFEGSRHYIALHFEGLLPVDFVFLPVAVQGVAISAAALLGFVGSAVAVGRFLRS